MSDTYGVQGDPLKTIYNSFSTHISSPTESSVLSGLIDTFSSHSGNNDGYLLSSLETVDGLITQLDSFNGSYNEMVDNLSGVIDAYNVSNSGGSVSTGGGTDGSGGYVSTGGYGGGDYTVNPYTPESGSFIESSSTPYARLSSSAVPTQASTPSTSYRDTSTGGTTPGVSGGRSIHTGASIGAGGSALASAVGGLGGPGESILPQTSYPLGNYNVNSSFINGLPKEVITEKLKNIGFTDDEISSIMGGEYNVSKVLVDEVSEKLADAYKADSGIRDYLKEQYGFDVFNEDGSVNNDRLSLALYMDDKTGLDEYSIISTLGNKYGISLVDQSALSNYVKEFESMFMKDSNIRKIFMEKYGFDVFNADGTINKDRLTLAMLIDKNSNGEYSLLQVLKDAKASSLVNSLGNNMVNITTDKNKSESKLPLLAGAVAVGTAAVGAGMILNKKKQEQDNEQDKEKRFITDLNYETSENDDYWVKDLLNNEEN